MKLRSLAFAAPLALVAAGLGTPAFASPAADGARRRCVRGARRRGRAHANGQAKDPHELTDAEVKAKEAALTRALSAKGLTRDSSGKLAVSGQKGKPTPPPPTGTVTIPVYFHVITDGSKGTAATGRVRQADQRPQQRLRRHGLQLQPRLDGRDQQRELVQRPRPGHPGARHEGRPAQGRHGRPQHLQRQPRQRPARLGDLPDQSVSAPRTASSSSTSRCPAATPASTARATPAPTRSATGSGSTTPSRAAVRATATT